MKALIIEDEKAAVRNLEALLGEVAPGTKIICTLDSITDSVAWFEANPAPDVVFMDIHLADGSAFEIFEHVRIECPVIFTTAYDEYALKAFKVNSIDYLLKPIGAADLRRALDKLEGLRHTAPTQESLSALIGQLQRREHYKTHFLVPFKGDKLLPLAVEQVQYFCIADGSPRPWSAIGNGTPYPARSTNSPTASIPNASSASTGSISFRAAPCRTSTCGSTTGWPSISRFRPTGRCWSASSASTNSRAGSQAGNPAATAR